MDAIQIIKKYYDEKDKLYNILVEHSIAVAEKSLEIAQIHTEWDLDKEFIYDSALLHDIGVFMTQAPKIQCFGRYPYICHGYLGAELMRKEGYPRHALVCERHTGSGLTKEDVKDFPIPYRDMIPESIEEKLICFTDKFFSKSSLDKIKTIDEVRDGLSRYGEASVARFDDLVKLFLGE